MQTHIKTLKVLKKSNTMQQEDFADKNMFQGPDEFFLESNSLMLTSKEIF